jgi:hypothetical protein
MFRNFYIISSIVRSISRNSRRKKTSGSSKARVESPKFNVAKPQFQPQFPYLPVDESQYKISPGRIDGFLGIPWGSSSGDAFNIMIERPNVKFEGEGYVNEGIILKFSDGMFGIFDVSKYILRFVDDALFGGDVFLKPEPGSTFLENWYLVKAELSSKYGAPPIDRKEFIHPYYEGDGLEATAFLTGKARVFCEWDFGNIGNRANTIMMFIDDPRNPMLNTIVSYLNNDLFGKALLGIRNVVPNDY